MAKQSHLSSLRNLLGRCNSTTVEILLDATALCRRLGHAEILPEHVVDSALARSDSDFGLLCRHFGLDLSSLKSDVNRVLNEQKTIGVPRPPMSAGTVELLERAWNRVSTGAGRGFIRSGDLYWAIATDANDKVSRPRRRIREATKVEELEKDFDRLVAHASEGVGAVEGGAGAAATDAPSAMPTGGGGTSEAPARGDGGYVAKYCVNFTLLAEQGKLDPVFGRDEEIREAIDILARRRKNNPILVGEPGVGKTAIVEGLALRIVQGDVPANFANFHVIGLDLGLMQAGASVKGEFEKRLKGVITEIKESPVPTIFFIDEAHTLVGAGGQAGGSDAANLLKPALARGELRSIAATTWSEYKQYFETDPALTRRFQLVHVKEPDLDDAKTMLRGLRAKYEQAHGIRILDSAIEGAVEAAKRYVAGRYLPDSAIDLIDTACAKVKNVLQSKPAVIDQIERDLTDLEIERTSVLREVEEGRAGAKTRLQAVDGRRSELSARLEAQRERWQVERVKVDAIHEVARQVAQARERLEEARQALDFEKAATIEREELAKLGEQLGREIDALKELQGDEPLLHAEVDSDTVLSVVAQWTGVPVHKMAAGDAAKIASLERHLGERIKGQEHAVQLISEVLKTHKAGIGDPNRPIGVFLCLGPSGVGKTEIALAVADILFGGDSFITKINMSEYSSGFSESRLIGAPPGYKGYGKGGVLTEAVRQKPYSVVLLDEVDRADSQVWSLFYSPFEKGEMNDGEGRKINFRNTCIFLTSNLGSDAILKWAEMRAKQAAPAAAGKVDADETAEEQLTLEALTEYLKDVAGKTFTMPLLARMTLVPFIPLDREALKEIVRLKLAKVKNQLKSQRKLEFGWDEGVPDWIVDRCETAGFGARLIDQTVQTDMLPGVTRELLAALARGESPTSVHVSVGANGAGLQVRVS
ncbi:MAG TPA: type VI secretion system ATPase TssH [Candidatus Krumholzibacteria bacterium]|nr:type VI secretion system ATPase TssH [Candidatus Krumholzibacteria bacterium]